MDALYRPRIWTLAATALALFAAALLFRLPFCTADLFTYDAADYSRAVRAGFLPQYLGTDSVSLVEFVRRLRSDPRFRVHGWGYLYQQNDGAALRHFHVPGAFYIPALLARSGAGERGQRISIAIISAATVMAAFWILNAAGAPLWLAALAGLFACCSPVLILAGSNLSPHPYFTLFSILAVYSFCRWLETESRRWMALFAVTFAASTASLELAPILFVTVIIAAACRWPLQRGLPPFRQIALCAGLIVSVLALLWPGGWLRGGYAMSYGVFVFQGVFRSGVYFQRRDVFSTVARLGHNPIAGCALAVLLLIAIWRAWNCRRNTLLLAFTMFASLLVIQGFGNGFTNPTYASHAVLSILLAGTLSFQAARDRFTVAILAALTLAGLSGIVGPTKEEALGGSRRVAGAIAELRRTYPEQSSFVVTQDAAPFIAYAPQFHFYPAESASSPDPKPWISVSSYRLLVDTGIGNQVPGTPLCPGPLAPYKFAVSCEILK